MLTYFLLRVMGIVIPLLPGRMGRGASLLLGDLSYVLQSRARRNVEGNLRHVMGAVNAKAAARTVFRTAALNYYDLFRIPGLQLAQLDKIVRVSGWEHFDLAFARGKGVIAIVPHLGNLDVVAQLPIRKAIPCTIPTEEIKPPQLLKLITRLRASRGIVIIPLDGTPGSARALYSALKRNELVGLVCDRDVLGNGLPVPFFGEVARIPTGPVALALRTGASLHGACALRRANGGFELQITPPLELPRTGDARRDLEVGTEIVVSTLEGFIRQAPEQWVVFEPIWEAAGAADAVDQQARLGGKVKRRLVSG